MELVTEMAWGKEEVVVSALERERERVGKLEMWWDSGLARLKFAFARLVSCLV